MTPRARLKRSAVLAGYVLIAFGPVFVGFACADPTGVSRQSAFEADAATGMSSDARQAELIALDSSDTSWPADCEEVYRLRAHGAETVGDATPYSVHGGGDEQIAFYFDRPWQGDRQLLMVRSVIDNRPIVHHWLLYTTENLHGNDASIFSTHNFLDQIALREAQIVVGGGFNPEEITVPDDVGLQLPSSPNSGFLLQFHYFSPDAGSFEADASAVELCVTSQPRAHTAAWHGLGRGVFELPAHEATEVGSTCVPSKFSEPVHIVALAPHMHGTGTHAKVVLNRASGEEVVLHDAPYDFEEQQVYWMNHAGSDVLMNVGDSLTTTCTFDNESDLPILSGPNKQNEMCDFFTWAWPPGILKNDVHPTLKNDCKED